MEEFFVDLPVEFGLEKVYGYGTAGFRLDSGVTLETIVKLCGIVACLRSKCMDGKGVGIMITASHNPKHQNGVKIVEPSGDMLIPEWEKVAEKFVNLSSVEEYRKLLSTYENVISKKGNVWVGHDTRSTSPMLSEQVREVMKTQFKETINIHNLGCVSTPQLHFMVYSSNLPSPPPKLSIELYYDTISENFLKFQNALERIESLDLTNRIDQVLVDCACAVGSKVVEGLNPYISSKLTVKPFNTYLKTPGFLNDGCGSDFVSSPRFPRTWENISNMFIKASVSPLKRDVRWSASFDGDADRVILFFEEEESQDCKILNGDKISSLFARFFLDVLKRSELDSEEEEEVTIGSVQTAYANGSSTEFLTKLLGGKKFVPCVPTGVKHLHHKAKEYSIGIYFEANGHGTVLFQSSFRELVKKKILACRDERKRVYLELLESMMGLINPAVGDAISDLLAIICCLNYLGIENIITQWNSWYEDLPSLLTKVKVKDRSVIKTVWDETKVVEPQGIQEKIDREVKDLKDPRARCFVRPSGTEDVVRVYCEASDMRATIQLSQNVEKIVLENL